MKPHYSNTNNPIDFPKTENKMNERIKALMGKTLDSEFSHTWDTMTYEGLLQFSEKFAELIVRECVERVAGSVVRDKGHIPQDPHSQGWNDAVAYAGKELKKYFGVE